MQRCYLLTGERLTGFDSALELIASAPRFSDQDSHALLFDRIRTDAIRAEHWTYARQADSRSLAGDRMVYTFVTAADVETIALPSEFKKPLYVAIAALSYEYQRLMCEAKAEFDAQIARDGESSRERQRKLILTSLKKSA